MSGDSLAPVATDLTGPGGQRSYIQCPILTRSSYWSKTYIEIISYKSKALVYMRSSCTNATEKLGTEYSVPRESKPGNVHVLR